MQWIQEVYNWQDAFPSVTEKRPGMLVANMNIASSASKLILCSLANECKHCQPVINFDTDKKLFSAWKFCTSSVPLPLWYVPGLGYTRFTHARLARVKLSCTASASCEKANLKGQAMRWNLKVCMLCGRAKFYCSIICKFRTFENF